MAKRNEPYRSCIVESYYPLSTAGLVSRSHPADCGAAFPYALARLVQQGSDEPKFV